MYVSINHMESRIFEEEKILLLRIMIIWIDIILDWMSTKYLSMVL